MKANEAPEKLYMNWVNYPLEEMQVEYTRTDAFIEKAAYWLDNFYNIDTHSYLIDEDIEKFINYMKGE